MLFAVLFMHVSVCMLVNSGVGTNLKVGGGAHVRREAPEKNILVVPLHFFGSASTISRLGERFYDGQYSLVSLLFAVLLTVPHI